MDGKDKEVVESIEDLSRIDEIEMALSLLDLSRFEATEASLSCRGLSIMTLV